MINPKRIRKLNEGTYNNGPVIYWMSRDQRVKDNWALLYAQKLSIDLKKPLAVVFGLTPKYLNATFRQYAFMIRGLEEVSRNLKTLNIPFVLLKGDPPRRISAFIKKIKAGVLISDFSPLKINKQWKNQVRKSLDIPFYEVDAHNIVPCWLASPKKEYGAYTLRPKIYRLLDEYMDEFPYVKKQNWPKGFQYSQISLNKLKNNIEVDYSFGEVDWIKPGEIAARNALKMFLENKISDYSKKRNDPNEDAQSDLSPYLHFGQISAQRVALETVKEIKQGENRKSFLEELVVRRELSDNFCYYVDRYDSFESFPDWARKTLKEHISAKRSYIYTRRQFEKAKTHDELWNAAQNQMVRTGKMHGFMRMYWAKKILEWTETPRTAIKIAIFLNDKYSLDGRDPNGYAGIAWSIGGVHDRAWNERDIFGKVRYMSYNGCKSKFNVKEYIRRNNANKL